MRVFNWLLGAGVGIGIILSTLNGEVVLALGNWNTPILLFGVSLAVVGLIGALADMRTWWRVRRLLPLAREATVLLTARSIRDGCVPDLYTRYEDWSKRTCAALPKGNREAFLELGCEFGRESQYVHLFVPHFERQLAYLETLIG